MRMKGARKNAQGISPNWVNMVIYAAGYPAIMGLQPFISEIQSSPVGDRRCEDHPSRYNFVDWHGADIPSNISLQINTGLATPRT
jgi:hypothetical protein